ncbi:hypothetical protein MMC26_000356 [Xylographa opegraphella]|nr:hypothetical protein [Xylographa opegraphella]
MSASRCNNDTNWDEVAKTCTKLRTGVSCTVNPQFTVGWQYLSKLINFDDGVQWAIHVPLDYTGPGTTSSIIDRMSRKVATYKFLKQKTAIPVPDVHGYSVNIDPSIGNPYILLTHVNGTLAARLEDYAEMSLRVQTEMMKVMVELASHKFDKIGSLAIDNDGQYYIGKDMDINAGPFETAEEYYDALSIHHFLDFTKYHFRHNVSAESCPSLHLPFMFNNYVRIYADCANNNRPFPLVYPGFGTHNIVLDRANKIICVNDVDNIMAAPILFAAQLPRTYSLNLPPPGREPIFSMPSLGLEEGLPQCARFVKMFRDEEERHDPLTPIANCMLSDSARLVEGLNSYGQMRIKCSNEWVRGYLYMYYHWQAGKADAKEFFEVRFLEDDKEVENLGVASSSASPYPGVEAGDDLESEPGSPFLPIVPKRKHIASHLGLTEAQQEDIMHLHRALQMDSARLVPDRTVFGTPQTKSAMDDDRCIFQSLPVGEVVDDRSSRKGSSWLSNFWRPASKPLVALQQPSPTKIARMRSLRKNFSSDSFRTTLTGSKTLDNVGLVSIPGRFPDSDYEQFGRDQNTVGAEHAVGNNVINESHNPLGGFAGLTLDDDNEIYHDAAVPQDGHRESGIYGDERPLL